MPSPVHEFSDLPRQTEVAKRAQTVEKADKIEPCADDACIGMIYNPRSHRNRGRDLDASIAPHIFLAQPGNRDQLPQALAEFAERKINLLIINGGDGTVRDVLTSGMAVFGDNWPDIAVLPKGKTNALTVDLEAPKDWSLQGAIEAFDSGRRITRKPVMIHPADDPDAKAYGFILGAGALTIGTQAGQGAHKLGAFNSLAVGATAVWGVVQFLFSGNTNQWRRGVKLDVVLDDDGSALAHSGLGDPERRQLLLASTLQKLPAGLKAFGAHREGLKLAVLDQITRRTAASLPLIVSGWAPDNLSEKGFHQLSTQGFTMELDEAFILDGEAFPAGRYRVCTGPELQFVAP
ncbi:MAG: diacylglycerol kinase family protein [Erythrobacter sp.]